MVALHDGLFVKHYEHAAKIVRSKQSGNLATACTETGADYVQGGFWKGDKVQATHDEWIITLDTYAVSTGKTTMVFTRLSATNRRSHASRPGPTVFERSESGPWFQPILNRTSIPKQAKDMKHAQSDLWDFPKSTI